MSKARTDPPEEWRGKENAIHGTDMRWVGLRRFFTRRAALVATPVVLYLAGGGVAAAAVIAGPQGVAGPQAP